DGAVGGRGLHRPGGGDPGRRPGRGGGRDDFGRCRLPGAGPGAADGRYWPVLCFGLLVFGAGLGSAFVAAQTAARTGAAEEESGLAAGRAGSSFHIGSALGIATLSSVAVARAGPGAGPAAMTEGFQAAFAVAAGVALLGAVLAVLLFWPRARGTGPL